MSDLDLTDADLLARWREGKREAYAVLVARYDGLVQTACRRQAPSGMAEDCAQAVFLILARRPAAAARATVLAAWLMRTAWFVCDRARRGERRRRHVSLDPDVLPTAQPAAPEALDHLDACLLRLPDKQRAAVTLHYLAGKTPEEVAAALQINRDNAYLLISRGLAGLRVLLARRGVAIAGAGLLSVLAAEADAAAHAVPSSLLANLSGAPSADATALAHGAMKTMFITSLTPYLAAAGLALAAGSLSVALTAEPTPLTATPAATTSSVPANDLQQEANENHHKQVIRGIWIDCVNWERKHLRFPQTAAIQQQLDTLTDPTLRTAAGQPVAPPHDLYIRPVPNVKADQPVIVTNPLRYQGRGSWAVHSDGTVVWHAGTPAWEKAQLLAIDPRADAAGISGVDWGDVRKHAEPQFLFATLDNNAIVRFGPSTSAKTIATLRAGTQITVISKHRSAEWLAILFPKEGKVWIHNSHLKPLDNGVAFQITTNKTRVHTDANHSADVIAELNVGDIVMGNGKEISDWRPVASEQIPAYVHASSVTMERR